MTVQTLKPPFNLYRTLWRWHFYAGLFCVPFIIILALSGSLYLFKPQVEAWLDRPYDHLAFAGAPANADDQIKAALAAVPGGSLKSYEVRQDLHDAARIEVRANGETVLVYVHPQTLAILQKVKDKDRPMEVIKTVHGELLMGDRGSNIVELAASWAIVMVVSGLYLWWPRQAQGLAGLVWPRLNMGKKLFWRDLHAVTGVWISSLALFLLLTGLPWTSVWGEGFKRVRDLTHTATVQQDWGQSRSAEQAKASASIHDGMDMPGMDMGAMEMDHAMMMPPHAVSVERMASTLRPLNLASPVLILPPSKREPGWTGKSDAQNRTLRVTMVLDPGTGAILNRENFNQRHPIDQIVGYGIAAHEGQLFGMFNQALGVLTAAGLCLLAVSGVILWWRRRPNGKLGAPEPVGSERLALGLGVLLIFFGLFLPLFGLSLIVVGLIERLVLRQIPGVRAWLSLRPA
ncbi:MAG: hypothetical protein RLZZ141_956 [Pseudomonadota bacterium]